MAKDVLIKASVLRMLRTFLTEYQISGSQFASFDERWQSLIDDDEAYIGQGRYMKTLELAALETGDPLFPLKLGLRTRLSDLGVMGRAVAAMPTLGAAARLAAKHLATYQQGATISLEPASEGHVRLTYRVGQRLSAALEADIDFTLGVLLGVLRAAVGPQWNAREVHVFYGPVEHKSTLERFVRSPVWFLQDASGIVFDASLLGLPMPGADPALGHALDAYLGSIEKTSVLKADIVSQLRLYIVSRLGSDDVSVGGAARTCHMSQRTLQRRLAEVGKTFVELVTETRRDIAERLLLASSLSSGEIGLRCGYTDPTNFHRAFVRWTGTTPGRFRREVSRLTPPDAPQLPA
ncbi:MAG: AraC family transcriptional regulator [Parvibaculum sp.]|nr:AraC family transcriptional regulator [Parvibaculum sp.]|tara:strand:+ start:3000 stop:4049 length:1050 start_codon:yes stop_codon:yes gene_type:complete